MRKKKTTQQEYNKEEIITLYVAGLSIRDIAARTNTSKSTVSRIIAPFRNTSTEQSAEAILLSPCKRSAIGGVASAEGVVNPTPAQSGTSVNHSSLITNSSPLPINRDLICRAADRIIHQMINVADGETDIAKLATAVDKLANIAEKIYNIERETQQSNTQGVFSLDFTNRHKPSKN